jgi:hypothetical protein
MILAPQGIVLATLLASLSTTPASQSGTEVGEAGNPAIVTTRPGNAVEYEIGDALNMAYVERDRLDSVDVTLRRRKGSHFSGRIGRQRVQISMDGSQISGTIGDRLISLRAERTGTQLHIDGAFGARAIALTMDPTSLRGQVGLCQYELSLQRGAYVGRVLCGGNPLRVRLTIPVSLASRSDVELSVMLTALLVR